MSFTSDSNYGVIHKWWLITFQSFSPDSLCSAKQNGCTTVAFPSWSDTSARLNRRHEMEDLKLRTVACKMAEEPFSLWMWIFISFRLHSGLLPLESTVHKWKYSDLYFSIVKISCCPLTAQPSCQNKMLATFRQIIDMLKYAHIKRAISIFLQHVQHHGHITDLTFTSGGRKIYKHTEIDILSQN